MTFLLEADIHGTATPRVAFHDLQPGAASFLDDVLAGLTAPQKALSPKYFYDAAAANCSRRSADFRNIIHAHGNGGDAHACA